MCKRLFVASSKEGEMKAEKLCGDATVYEEDIIVSLHVNVHDSRRAAAEAEQPSGIASHLHTIRLRISSHHARYSDPFVPSTLPAHLLCLPNTLPLRNCLPACCEPVT
jgi:hypothetical protein